MKRRFGPPPEGYIAWHDWAEAQTRTLSIPVNLRIIPGFQDDPDVIARVYYPEEGNEIHIIKGLNRLEFDRAVLHELSHLFDWYLGEQSAEVSIREACACNIAEALYEAQHVYEHEGRPIAVFNPQNKSVNEFVCGADVLAHEGLKAAYNLNQAQPKG